MDIDALDLVENNSRRRFINPEYYMAIAQWVV